MSSLASERARYWDEVYERAGATNVSWYQPDPSASVEMIRGLGVSADSAIIDVGGGASNLVDAFMALGLRDLTVLDVSGAALDAARDRLGERARGVTWVHADLLAWEPPRRFDVWHDRAVLHFLVDDQDRVRYRELARRAVRAGGHLVIGTFALDGPPHCSGLPVKGYDPEGILKDMGEGFDLVDGRRDMHTTPAGADQPFSWALLRTQ
ncbi:MAG: class I SAM-dependent methyltransferase [Acidimicrobiales bacterium]